MLGKNRRIEIIGLLVGVWFILSLTTSMADNNTRCSTATTIDYSSNDWIDISPICWSSHSMDSKARISK